MIPRFKPFLGSREFLAIFTPARSSAILSFEKAFAQKMKQKYALSFPYGRTGMMMLLRALGLKDKEVICPAYTCVVVPHAITYSKNIPVFVDSSKDDYNMDYDLIEQAISEETGAIIATSIFGNPVNLDRLNEVKEKFPHVHIIQDCAHSFGAEWKGMRVNIGGVAAVYGLNISKIMTSVFGGMITTDSEDLYLSLKKLRDSELEKVGITKSIMRRSYLLAIYIAFNPFIYSFVNFLERHGFLKRFVKYFDETKIDMPGDYLDQMTNFEAEIGLIQTAKYDQIITKRQQLGKIYDRYLGVASISGKTYSHYPVLVNDRANVLARALGEGIQLGTIIDYSCEKMAVYKRCKFFTKNGISNVGFFRENVINIPMVLHDDVNAGVLKFISSLER
ncbi:MAG: hypothetical protein A2504_11760 [Bdellovibrionales bacterium RIFOXYD12_FULL_39_22]|nr:MAG: hypothetical protein A2385_16275 [Bdellovibrionales bacterium RIFOXYB1_FULL_39_21]OFZ44486.1 MAG: hypothetical protein A2485_06620 [Bdellovibrionales bacterium RIFOXYC12_FULL_39_17]OFZ49872.1 MAG: hypothetical protein A2404_00845 [Bdellovibrionales bacterium RIFOXYC1_FULL_39_130]OFZ76877.1 MAG: hypothetical protein A2560_05645 [Bdellovibrionales bacterium RIFOXYD1_FULL_39_84]OFZ95804.1 MAG: hypothetical protein A2504_11760 [Bdellovibrionales bacterium RIFOXYD12_FULL_39_22]HLE10823.1 De